MVSRNEVVAHELGQENVPNPQIDPVTTEAPLNPIESSESAHASPLVAAEDKSEASLPAPIDLGAKGAHVARDEGDGEWLDLSTRWLIAPPKPPRARAAEIVEDEDEDADWAANLGPYVDAPEARTGSAPAAEGRASVPPGARASAPHGAWSAAPEARISVPPPVQPAALPPLELQRSLRETWGYAAQPGSGPRAPWEVAGLPAPYVAGTHAAEPPQRATLMGLPPVPSGAWQSPDDAQESPHWNGPAASGGKRHATAGYAEPSPWGEEPSFRDRRLPAADPGRSSPSGGVPRWAATSQAYAAPPWAALPPPYAAHPAPAGWAGYPQPVAAHPLPPWAAQAAAAAQWPAQPQPAAAGSTAWAAAAHQGSGLTPAQVHPGTPGLARDPLGESGAFDVRTGFDRTRSGRTRPSRPPPAPPSRTGRAGRLFAPGLEAWGRFSNGWLSALTKLAIAAAALHYSGLTELLTGRSGTAAAAGAQVAQLSVLPEAPPAPLPPVAAAAAPLAPAASRPEARNNPKRAAASSKPHAVAGSKLTPMAAARRGTLPEAEEPAAPSDTPARAPEVLAQASPATLRINSVPWSQVFVDGALVGHTPQLNLRLSAGPHHVRLVNPELEVSKSFELQASAGEIISRVERLSN